MLRAIATHLVVLQTQPVLFTVEELKSVALIETIETLFQNPPIPYEPTKHSLKAWAMYCLRDRGFKVVYAQNADFAIEPRTGDKLYFRVTDNADAVDNTCGWIVWDADQQQATITPPPTA